MLRCMLVYGLCISVAVQARIIPHLRQKDTSCVNCEQHIVNVNDDFNKLKTDPELTKHVSVILNRLKTFKIPVHPRIRIFYELLKVGMSNYAHRTADSLYVPNKYNELINPGNKEP